MAPVATRTLRPTCPMCQAGNVAGLLRFRFSGDRSERRICAGCVRELVEALAEPSERCPRCWRLRANMQALMVVTNLGGPTPVFPAPPDRHRPGCVRFGI